MRLLKNIFLKNDDFIKLFDSLISDKKYIWKKLETWDIKKYINFEYSTTLYKKSTNGCFRN